MISVPFEQGEIIYIYICRIHKLYTNLQVSTIRGLIASFAQGIDEIILLTFKKMNKHRNHGGSQVYDKAVIGGRSEFVCEPLNSRFHLGLKASEVSTLDNSAEQRSRRSRSWHCRCYLSLCPPKIMKVVEDHHISRTSLIHHISAYIILPYNISYDISLAHAQWMENTNRPNQRPGSSCRDSVLSRKVAHLLDVATWHGFVAQKEGHAENPLTESNWGRYI